MAGYTLTSPTMPVPKMTSGLGPRNPILINGHWTAQYHYGQDYAYQTGAPLLFCRRSSAGTAFVKWEPNGFGHWVYIKCDDDFGIVYAHLDSVNILNGQRVNFNTLIGHSGQSGSATGPHLHLELHRHFDARFGQLPREVMVPIIQPVSFNLLAR